MIKKKISIIVIISLLSISIILFSNKQNHYIKKNYIANIKNNSNKKYNSSLSSDYRKIFKGILFQINALENAKKNNDFIYKSYSNIYKFNINYSKTQKKIFKNKINIANLSITKEIYILNSIKNIVYIHPYNYLKFIESKNYIIPTNYSIKKTDTPLILNNSETYTYKINNSNTNIDSISYQSEEALIGGKSISSLISNSKTLLISKPNFNYNNVFYFSNNTNSLKTLNKNTSVLKVSNKNNSETRNKFISNLKANQIDNSKNTTHPQSRKKNTSNYIIHHPYIIVVPIIGFAFITALIVGLTKETQTTMSKKSVASIVAELEQTSADINPSSPDSIVKSKTTDATQSSGAELDLIQDIISSDDSIPNVDTSPYFTYARQNNYQTSKQSEINTSTTDHFNSTLNYPYSDSPYFESPSLADKSVFIHKTGTKRKNYSRISGYDYKDTKKLRLTEYQDISNSDLVNSAHPIISQDRTGVIVTEGPTIPIIQASEPNFITDEHKIKLNKVGLSNPKIISSRTERSDLKAQKSSKLLIMKNKRRVAKTTTVYQYDKPIVSAHLYSVSSHAQREELNIPIQYSSQTRENLPECNYPSLGVLPAQEINKQWPPLDYVLSNEGFFRFLYNIRSVNEKMSLGSSGTLLFYHFRCQISDFLYLENILPNMGTSDINPHIIRENIQSKLIEWGMIYRGKSNYNSKSNELICITYNNIVPVCSTRAKTTHGWFPQPVFRRNYMREKITKEEYDRIKMYSDEFDQYLTILPFLKESSDYYNNLSLKLKDNRFKDSISVRSDERNKFIANQILLDLKEVVVSYRDHLNVSWMKPSDVIESEPSKFIDVPNYTRQFFNTSLVRSNFGNIDNTGLSEKNITDGFKAFFNNYDFKL